MYSLIKTRTCGFCLVSAARKVPQVTPKNESIMIHNFARIRERKIQTNCSLQLHFVFPISLPENVICFAQKQRVNKQTIITTIYIYCTVHVEYFWLYKVKISSLDICVLQTRRVNLMEVVNWLCGEERREEGGGGRGVGVFAFTLQFTANSAQKSMTTTVTTKWRPTV